MVVVAPSPQISLPQSGKANDAKHWQRELKDAVRDPRDLCRLLNLPAECEAAAIRAAGEFPLFAPRPFVDQIERGNPADPLLRQILPLEVELASPPSFTADPVGDLAARRAPGLLQKYHGRTLLITTGACAVHCRYCFRRHFPYSESQSPQSATAWQPAIETIAADASIREVILSGGDPLVLVDGLLAELAERLAAIPHVARLRVHTRLPLMIPQRIDASLLGWLRGTRLTPIMVIHANHPAELRGPAAAAIGRLVDGGVPVLNQSVLLRGVNDDADVLAELCERLVELRAMPYYLHQLDRVAGAAHFEVEIARGVQLIEQLRERLPGYAVPRYVRETAGEPNKTPLCD
ncbi:MAG TPA: EF-P beta-lysylation protein EpmB [Pirellulales bacterium]|nr:EF-P beta-lysylation protein EpmB [Pirellulales bacterium]